MITLDFETFYDREYSLTKLTTEAYIRDPRFQVIGVGIKVGDQPAAWYPGDQADEVLRSMDFSREMVLAHHCAFDGAILAWRYGIRPMFLLDTLSMARPLHGITVGGSLKALAQHYDIGAKGTEVIAALGKRLQDFTPDELAAYGQYCVNDVELTAKLFHILKRGFPKSELLVIDMMLRMFTEPALQLDRTTLEEHLNGVRQRKEDLMAKVTMGREELMSNPKFAELLRSMGVEPPMKVSVRTGKETYAFAKTDQGLVALLEHEKPEVQAVVAARLGVKSTLEETRTEAFIGIAERGPLPIMLNYYGGHTGRASGGDKVNLQNLPRGGALRKAICAPEGTVLCVGDSAQIEARVVAWLASQADLVEAFAQKRDIYSEFATTVYGYEVTKANNPTERHVGKTGILGLGYGMGAKKFQATLKAGMGGPPVEVDDYDAERIVSLYRKTYAMIPAMWRRAHQMVEAIHCKDNATLGPGDLIRADGEGVYLPNGMMLRYPGLERVEKGYTYKNRRETVKLFGGKLVENIVQALARIVVFDQMLHIHKRYKVVLTVHDEIVCLAPAEGADEAKAFMIETMSKAPAWATGLPVSCDVGLATRYGAAK